ncbi:hypothetical protein BP5796_00415 [Coleophoma crateriformis]|uniref:Uncharacterized protein n=1 Tax=Coleophoma crateriformis TaxID=565419 RepID=A0A3D8T7T3_9HELO|nr:hypothetical protein BP5796_00415 [Coleophoma crateriformis]
MPAPTPSLPITIANLTPPLLESISNLLSGAFAVDPLARCNRLLEDSSPNETVVEKESWMKMWRENITTKLRAGAELVEVADWTALALWFPPGVKKSTFDRTTSPAPLLEYFDSFEAIKEKYLHGRKYWYLNLIARDPQKREKG